MIDFTILTDHRYVDIVPSNDYEKNVLREDELLKTALESRGFEVFRTNWDNKGFDWSTTKYVIFRTTWDYFDRFPEFSKWLSEVEKKTTLINPSSLIYWNIDKHYLNELSQKGVRIPPSIFIEKGENRKLVDFTHLEKWNEVILKPVVSGAARHTYRFKVDEVDAYEEIYRELIQQEGMMLQEFQKNIVKKGEISLILFGGKFSHAVLKIAKKGDFRVQDDFGGTVEEYTPSDQEIKFAENAVSACEPQPLYARVDIMWDNNDELCLGELELIEPELWFRLNSSAADNCVDAIIKGI